MTSLQPPHGTGTRPASPPSTLGALTQRLAPLGQSLRFRLAAAIALAVIITSAIAALLAWRAMLHEAHEIQDESLEQAAELLRPEGKRSAVTLPKSGCLRTDDDEEGIIVQRLDYRPPAPSTRKDDDDDDNLDCLPLSTTLKKGYHDITHQGVLYRVYVHDIGKNQRIAVAQDTLIRDNIARKSAWYAALPLLVLIPLLLILVLALLHLMLRPLAALARTVDSRHEQDLQPLPQQNLPIELRPFVTAINRLLGRTEAAMHQQRRFVADAAHELRSPLAALSLQAERLQAAPMSAEAAERLGTLRAGIERGRHLLEQLLSLARAQNARMMRGRITAHAGAAHTGTGAQNAAQHPASTTGTSTGAPAGTTRTTDTSTVTDHNATSPAAEAPITPLLPVLHRILEDLLPLADRKHINLGMAEVPPDATVQGDELSLYTLLRNLTDNAIRYTPEHGQIDLWATAHHGHLTLGVEDNGPGIPASERTRVLDPFYRVLGSGEQGSGLGLSIVGTLTDTLGGTLRLCDAQRFPRGLRVEITLPAAPAQTRAASARTEAAR